MNYSPDLIANTGMPQAAIRGLLDPLIAQAEKESSQRPVSVDVPGGFVYDGELAKLIEKADAAWSAWAEADTRLVEAIEDHREAVEADARALRDAIKKGATKHPGHPAAEKARLNIEFAVAACRLAREEASKHASPLRDMLRASVAGLRAQALEAVEEAEKVTEAIISTTRSGWDEMNHKRARASAMARWIGENSGQRVSGEGTETFNSLDLPIPYKLPMQFSRHILERSA
ncbi:MAG: hypothetical protein RJQ01_00805 [Microcella sp.]|uniref:hypothetical protein n=1 Tax=Microcella sp. TaxID=1913979 RepID=UPI003314FB40